MKRTPWPMDAPLPIKTPCPICGGKLFVEAGANIEQDENGEWIATDIGLFCEAEFCVDPDELCEWHDEHYATPYIDWLPIEIAVLAEIQRKFFFPAPETAPAPKTERTES